MLTEADLPRFQLDGESFVRPDFAGRGLANVAPTVLRLLAPTADGLELPPLDASILPEALTYGVRTVILLVADGLGHLQLQREIASGKVRGPIQRPCDSGKSFVRDRRKRAANGWLSRGEGDAGPGAGTGRSS